MVTAPADLKRPMIPFAHAESSGKLDTVFVDFMLEVTTVIQFEKVPFEQFYTDCVKLGWVGEGDSSKELLSLHYDDIILPKRATEGSAGYDFFLPLPFCMDSKTRVTVPTGIRVHLDSGMFLMLAPRSGLGAKYGMKLRNTIGIVDEDYYNANNYGHILARISSDFSFHMEKGDRFMQGVIIPFCLTDDDQSDQHRIGGFGSTGSL